VSAYNSCGAPHHHPWHLILSLISVVGWTLLRPTIAELISVSLVHDL
jgi:hypothetical protein